MYKALFTEDLTRITKQDMKIDLNSEAWYGSKESHRDKQNYGYMARFSRMIAATMRHGKREPSIVPYIEEHGFVNLHLLILHMLQHQYKKLKDLGLGRKILEPEFNVQWLLTNSREKPLSVGGCSLFRRNLRRKTHSRSPSDAYI